MSRFVPGNGATGGIKEEISCFATEGKEVNVKKEEGVVDLDWIEPEDEGDEVLSPSPDKQPTMVPINTKELLTGRATDERCMEIMAGINQRRGGTF